MTEMAVGAGRMFAVFELLGTPAGFLDVHAATAQPDHGTAELGGSVATTDRATLSVSIPTVLGLDPTLPAPEISATIIRVDANGPTVIASGAGPTLSAAMSSPGAYRVEIWMVPHHLGPYLGDLGTGYANVSVPWVYTNPIYVQ